LLSLRRPGECCRSNEAAPENDEPFDPCDLPTGRATTPLQRPPPQRSGGFNGGARPAELRKPETHGATITRLVLQSRAFRSKSFSIHEFATSTVAQ
jgi:hypothetical protein